MSELLPAASLSLTPLLLVIAFFLDWALGDPRWLPHPVRVIGRGITVGESLLRRYFRTPPGERAAGVMLVALIVAATFAATLAAQKVLLRLAPANPFLGWIVVIVLIYLVATTIAARELIQSARLVLEAVKRGDLGAARRSLGMIVGRDTRDLSEKDALKATIETLAENLSDGVVAPLFYLTLGGLPLAMAYKAINTLDSMVGYRNERYLHFGWAAARLDDAANYVPARITGLLIVAAVFILTLPGDVRRAFVTARHAFGTMVRDGRKHLSPNSGIPEAAVAGALGVRLGGPSSYGGRVVQKPYIGEETEAGGASYLEASERTIAIARVTSLLGIAVAVAVLCLRVST